MKKLMAILMMLCCTLALLPVDSLGMGEMGESAGFFPMTAQAAAEGKAADDRDYPDFCGRLTIPDANINVALYDSYAQSVCDRWDSACCFKVKGYSGKIIADHSNQEFSTLTTVKVGTRAEIAKPDGSVIALRCAEVINGHNTGKTLTNSNGKNVMGKYDYLSYTCMKGWRNVRICQWEIVDSAA